MKECHAVVAKQAGRHSNRNMISLIAGNTQNPASQLRSIPEYVKILQWRPCPIQKGKPPIPGPLSSPNPWMELISKPQT